METRKNFNWKRLFISFLSLVFFSACIFSCQTDDETAVILTDEQEVEVLENNSQVEASADEDLDIVFEAEQNYSSQERMSISKSATCAALSWDSTSFTLKVDFGEGCVGPYGKERSGIIYIQFDGEPGTLSNKKTITFENYMVNNRQIEGTILIDKFSRNEQGNYVNQYSLQDYKVSFPNNESFTINGQRTREFLQGINDGLALKMRITGATQGMDSRGRSFTAEIIEPIIADVACATSGGFIRVSGIKEMVYNGAAKSKTRTILYGDGTCDHTIEVIINGKSFIITKS